MYSPDSEQYQAAQSAYANGGDQGLADYYINLNEQTAGKGLTRAELNPARAVAAGKKNVDGSDFTFADAANDEIQNYNVAQAKWDSTKGDYHPSAQGPGELKNTFQFVIDHNNSQGNQKSDSTSASNNAGEAGKETTNSNTSKSSGDSKYSWQQSKEKAQAWQAENEKVNEWKKTFNTNTGQGGFNQQYDFSSKNFMGT